VQYEKLYSAQYYAVFRLNPLNTKLNSFCHLLVLLGTHLILHISRIRVNMVVVTIYFRAMLTYVLQIFRNIAILHNISSEKR